MEALDLIITGEYTKKYSDEELPFISIIIPTLNCAQSISVTLNLILGQDYPNFEVIAIDAGSVDCTLDLLQRYRDSRLKVYTVPAYHRYEMFNKGIELAQGEYLNFLFPGDFYIRSDTLKIMMTEALDKGKPHLVYCGTMIRDGKSEVKFMYRALKLNLLRNGQQPTSLQACWYRKETFEKLGNFCTDYKMRGGFDFLCRFLLKGEFRHASLPFAFMDYDLRWVTHLQVWQHFWDTIKVVYRHFGLRAALTWFYKQKDIGRFMRLWLRNLEVVKK